MKLLDLTLTTPAENLALDEALLDAAEAGELPGDVLRLWEPSAPLVVVGRSSRVAEEVDLAACQAAGIAVLRRASGGAAVVGGPGCLMYSAVLGYAGREHLRLIDQAHKHVLGIVQAALSPLVSGIEHLGTCDLAIGGRKFSGNAVRCKRDHLLYHGTLLYAFDSGLIGRLLRTPPRQPDYRAGRSHEDFVMNLSLPAAALRRAIATAFSANENLPDWPRQRTARLAIERYENQAWNFER
jgi:lipoate-protein ligase A